jgi:uncharacterized membrane protein
MTTPSLYMDAVLTPNRSLSRKGLWVLLGLFCAANLLICVFLLAIGAFPVPIFLGLDVIGVLIAFRVSNRRARIAERVRVSADLVEVLREGGGRSHVMWSSPTAFTQVSLDQAEPGGLRLRLRLAGRALTLASDLGPEERADFAVALQKAIRTARDERHPTGPA